MKNNLCSEGNPKSAKSRQRRRGFYADRYALVSAFLSSPELFSDEADARHDVLTIEGLRADEARNHTLGHGFGFTVIHGDETLIPVVPKACHKINSGPFVQTP